MKKHFVILWLIYLSLVSCHKDKSLEETTQTFIEGHIINSITGDSIPGARVELWEDDRGGSLLIEDYDRKLGETITDENGYFKIHYLCSNIKYKGIIPFKENITNYNTVATVNCSRTYVQKRLMPLSRLRIHIKNINPFDDNDSLYYYYHFSLVGQNIDTILYRTFATDALQVDKWNVTKNAQTTSHYSIITCLPHDTCSLNIIY
ncbi:MAG: hypothetical protein H0U27_12235 [Nitrosopumilus sp.]|nr:hypothetical protein [Nitrosopumilus sp.]